MRNKITHVHVYLIGAVLMIIVGGGLYAALLRPAYAENAVIKGKNEQLTSDVNSKKKAPEKLAAATAEMQRKKSSLTMIERAKQLPPNERIDWGKGDNPVQILERTTANWLNLPRVVVT